MADASLKFILETIFRGKGVQDAKAEMKGLDSSLAALSKAATIGTTALLAVGAAAAALVIKSTLVAARVETLGVVLRNVGKSAGYNSGQLIKFEESVKSMGITTQAARQSLLQMMQANLDLADASKIARLAQDAAVIAGINSSQAFERLVTAIQRGETDLLRTMGIIVSFEGAYKAMADSLGISTSQLTVQEKTQARVNEVMKVGLGIVGSYESAMGTAGKQMFSLERYIEEAQVTIGEKFLPVMSSAVTVATEFLKAFQEDKLEGLVFFAKILAIAAKATETLVLWNIRLNKAIDEHEEVVLKSSVTYKDYWTEMLRTAVASKRLTEYGAAAIAMEIERGEVTVRTAQILEDLGIKTSDTYEITRRSVSGLDTWHAAMRKSAEAAEAFAAGAGPVMDAFRGLVRVTEEIEPTPLDFSINLPDWGQLRDDIEKSALVGRLDLVLPVLLDPRMPDEERMAALAEAAKLEIAADVRLGEITKWEGVKQLAEELEISREDAAKLLAPLLKQSEEDFANLADTFTASLLAKQATWQDIMKTTLVDPTEIMKMNVADATGMLFELKGKTFTTFLDIKAYIEAQATRRAQGGALAPVTEVGEEGTEGIINGMVIPHNRWERMKDQGLVVTQGLAGGGPLIDRLVGAGGALVPSAPVGESNVVNNDNRQVMPGVTVNINNQLDLRAFELLWRQMLGG